MTIVRRFVLPVIVLLLTVSASGIFSLAMSEPCGSTELVGGDSACPPTCVTCGCCAQAAEPAMLVLTGSPEAPVSADHRLITATCADRSARHPARPQAPPLLAFPFTAID